MVTRWLLVGYSLVTRWLLVAIKHSQALVLNKFGVLHRMTLIGHARFSQFMKWHNLGIATLKHALCSPNFVSKLPENQITTNSIYLTSPDFVTISHINY